ncbi:MAG: nucleotidyltransferase family protein [TACK group archaeon]|nr:nucleotidyltransferase family protein [TACK group archaeon]
MTSLNGLPLDGSGPQVLFKVGYALGHASRRALIGGDSLEPLISGVCLAGGTPYIMQDVSNNPLFFFACRLFSFPACARIVGGKIDLLLGGRAPAKEFLDAMSLAEPGHASWNSVSAPGALSVPESEYLAAASDFFAAMGTDLSGKKAVLVSEDESCTALSSVSASLVSKLGGIVTTFSRGKLPLASARVYSCAKGRISPVHRTWGRAEFYATAVNFYRSVLNGSLLVGLDAPYWVEEEVEKTGGMVIRQGLSVADVISEQGSMVALWQHGMAFPQFSPWVDPALELVAMMAAEENEHPTVHSLYFSGEGSLDDLRLQLEFSSGWGWKGGRGRLGRSYVLAVQRDRSLWFMIEDTDGVSLREAAEELRTILPSLSAVEERDWLRRARLKGAVLAGGLGTRLMPLTTRVVKPALPVGGCPLIRRAVMVLRLLGINEVAVVVSPRTEAQVRSALQGIGSGIQFLTQSLPLGTAHAVSQLESFADEDVLVVSSDVTLSSAALEQLIAHRSSSRAKITLLGVKVADARRYGVLLLEGERLVQVVEKPEIPLTNVVNSGIYIASPEVIENARSVKPSPRGEMEITDLFQQLAWHGDVDVFIDQGNWWHDVGELAGLLAGNRYYLENPQVDVSALGHLVSAGTSKQLNGGNVMGPSFVSQWASVQGEIGPYSALDFGAVVESGAMVTDSLLMAGARVRSGSSATHAVLGPGAILSEKVVGSTEKPILVV